MNTRKYVLSVITAFVLSNVLATTWYAIMDEPNFVSFRREEVNYLGLMLNHLVFAVIFVHLFPAYYDKKLGPSRSVVYGALMAAVMFVPSGIVVRSIWTVDFNSIFVLNAIAHMVIGVVISLAITQIYKFKRTK